jgi:hypothetical protein
MEKSIKMIVFLLCISSASVYSQSPDTALIQQRNNHLYLELGASSLVYGLQYERIFWRPGKLALAASSGILPASPNGNGFLKEPGFPLELKLLAGASRHHRVEFGLSSIYYISDMDPVLRKYTPFRYVLRDRLIYFGRIGYRYTARNGFVFRAAITPYRTHRLFANPEYEFWGGLSLGYCF